MARAEVTRERGGAMNRRLWVTRNLVYHRRLHVSVALGVAAATAVLTGALLVGASMRGSLRNLTLNRLGLIDEVMTSSRFVEAEPLLAAVREERQRVAGIIWTPGGTVETVVAGAVRRATEVQLLGGDSDLWEMSADSWRPPRLPVGDEVIINRTLAADLGLTEANVATGEALVTIRLPREEALSSDSPLGEKEDLTFALPRLKVIAVMPDAGLGRFGLSPTQLAPRNAILDLERLQEVYEVPGRVNTVLAGDQDLTRAPQRTATAELGRAWTPSLSDWGVLIKRARRTFPDASENVDDVERVVFDAYQITSDRMVIEARLEPLLSSALEGLEPRPMLTYLANDIAVLREGQPPTGRDGVPFSMVTAISFDESYAPLSAVTGKPITGLQDNEIALNAWAAGDLGAKIGDMIRLTFFLPETTHGQTEESHYDLRLVDIAALTEPARPSTRRESAKFETAPTLANDPDLTPEVPGVTDQESIENWDLPFPTADRIRRVDDIYWQNHRTTPKAFVSLGRGRELWGSRFGQLTGFRVEAGRISQEELEGRIRKTLGQAADRQGLDFLAVKADGLSASSGTTPFDGLFLGLSLFVIAAALILVVLLFRLGLEKRLDEIGTLLALGFSRRQVAMVLATEGAIVAAIGGVLGVGLGVGYAGLMILGLRTWWVGAVRTPFLELVVSPTALVIGYCAGLGICVATIVFTLSRFRPDAVHSMLRGRMSEAQGRKAAKRKSWWLPAIAGGLALLFGIAATRLGGEAQAGAFLASGAAVLVGVLAGVSRWLGDEARQAGVLDLPRTALRNIRRNPTRSILTMGLVASATFLIGGVSAFRLAPTERGVGGFDLIATTSRPIFVNLAEPTEREARLGSAAQELGSMSVLAFRWRRGDDASCNNPFRATRPQVMGVSEDVIAWFDREGAPGFAWAGTVSDDARVRANPWRSLQSGATGDSSESERDSIPVVIDKNTAMWGLQIYQLGQEFEIDYDEAGRVRFRVVAFLNNTVLQGKLWIADRDFRRLFPEIAGDQFFLIRSGEPPRDETRDRAREVLEDRFSDVGMATRSSVASLEELLAVQNTYLSTFQSLGALGLLLGTLGVATVQLRSVIERRSELALMQAIGFSRGRLIAMIFLENSALLLGGLGMGWLAASCVTLPHWWFGDASIPWWDLVGMLGLVAMLGMATGVFAVRGMLGISVREALDAR